MSKSHQAEKLSIKKNVPQEIGCNGKVGRGGGGEDTLNALVGRRGGIATHNLLYNRDY